MIVFFFFFLHLPAWADEPNIFKDDLMLVDKSTQEKCQEYHQIYQEKIDLKLRNKSLRERIETLMKHPSFNDRQISQKKLKLDLKKLQIEYGILEKHITDLSEKLIRSGCPGENTK